MPDPTVPQNPDEIPKRTSLIVEFDEESSEFLPTVVGRLICSTCGFLANVDPDFHAERYAHLPTVRSATEVYTYYPATGRFHRNPARSVSA